MPSINVKIMEGVFSPAQKQEIIRKLSDAMVSIKGENLRASTAVIVEEIKSSDAIAATKCKASSGFQKRFTLV